MIEKKHYDVILTELIKGNRIRVCNIDDVVWFLPQARTYAIAIPKCIQFFDLAKIEVYDEPETFKPKNTTELMPTGIMEKEKTVILHELKSELFITWAVGDLLKLFPFNKYTYHAEGKHSPIFCKSRSTNEIEGLILPIIKGTPLCGT